MNDLAQLDLLGHNHFLKSAAGGKESPVYSGRGCVHYTLNELRVALVGYGLFHLMLLPRFERR